jgi:Na+-transporting methylmalonyl-CoA/oxaloacetate decarboxylase gamma subunit
VTGTLAFVFIAVALVCVVAGVSAVARTRRATREDAQEYGDGADDATYEEEAAAVAAAQAAAAARDEPEPGPDVEVDIDLGPDVEYEGPHS